MGNRIRHVRKANNMKQSTLAAELNISQATLSLWENGVFEPDQKSIFKLCEYFNVSSDFILGRDLPCQETNDSSYIKERHVLENILLEKGLSFEQKDEFIMRFALISKEQALALMEIIRHFK